MRRAAGFAGMWVAWASLVTTPLPADVPTATREKSVMAKFKLTSADLTVGGRIAAAQVFNQFGCTGGNVSPALAWTGAPAETHSFALLVHDPDAPTGSGWWHWILYNIPANTAALPAGAGDPARKLLPAGTVQGRNDYGSTSYGGPCPPPGKPHHYHFRLYALKAAKLDLPVDASAALIGFNVRAQALAEAELVGLYGR